MKKNEIYDYGHVGDFPKQKANGKSGSESLPEYKVDCEADLVSDPSRLSESLTGLDWAFTDDATNFLTHGIHPYPAKYIPQIPGHLISMLSVRGDLVLDPFGGSGTTALEAVRLGRRALSYDLNPIGTLIGKVKTAFLSKSAVTDLHAIRCAVISKSEEKESPADRCEKYAEYIPGIPNMDKWFSEIAQGELALIKSCVASVESKTARDVGNLVLAKIVLKSSFQDSETRYVSKPFPMSQGYVTDLYIKAFDNVLSTVLAAQNSLKNGVSNFVTGNFVHSDSDVIPDQTVDLIVTSPPYGNAMDYHLYHRFRLFWIGEDPRLIGKEEIGSHLRHQKNSTGFEHYLEEMQKCITQCYRVLRPGKHMALVVGDAVYKKKLYHAAEELSACGSELGFEEVALFKRSLHKTKRSFTVSGRRANDEKILVMRKPPRPLTVSIQKPGYKMWPYEEEFLKREVSSLLKVEPNGHQVEIDCYSYPMTRKLTFSSGVKHDGTIEPTWQSIVECQPEGKKSKKESKYATHGIHEYKGKYYPQLAKSLLNIFAPESGKAVLDPFCGSGTTLLEGSLLGHTPYGCDMNPLAAKIASAKVNILNTDAYLFRETLTTVARKVVEYSGSPQPTELIFSTECMDEIQRWFPQPVIGKLSKVLGLIRSVSTGSMRDFLEIVLSSVVREVSQQEPRDLRIRKRKEPIDDADVYGLFLDKLSVQRDRIEHLWSVLGHSPCHFQDAMITHGDSRQWEDLEGIGVRPNKIDLVLTSPPYATALPYIDTDRLSLLTILGMKSSTRRPLENGLVGSREIGTTERRRFEETITSSDCLPSEVASFILDYQNEIMTSDVGFRRKNMPSLLTRFFIDMAEVLKNCHRSLKTGGHAVLVIGDNKTTLNGRTIRIPTTDFIEKVGNEIGFRTKEKIDISVTTDNHMHIKNAITKNVVLCLTK
jgi:DNA modification methylase